MERVMDLLSGRHGIGRMGIEHYIDCWDDAYIRTCTAAMVCRRHVTKVTSTIELAPNKCPVGLAMPPRDALQGFAHPSVLVSFWICEEIRCTASTCCLL